MTYCDLGLDHLLFSGRGAGGSDEEESTELHVACFMGLVSFFAGRPEVLRLSPRHTKRVLNEAARGIIQSASATDTPLTDAGLDGTGEVIQVREAFLQGWRLLRLTAAHVLEEIPKPSNSVRQCRHHACSSVRMTQLGF